MSENRLPDYLDHIQQAATDARSFVEGMAKDDFLADKRTQRAQRDFLERHLAAWAPLVRAEVNAKVTTQFFVALADLAERFVAADLERVRRELAP
ncbi:hypothetical protein [Methylobacillus sp.]|jgi:TorA maturation chaperone TorD|uniref:hypothetical protein n=1 Tax=Methylobacillus sp. TaxID=56818 RepID=UPI0012C5D98F|nr:hypothetical protein [Methylobacillus sp.]MPS50039.1 hypothetical protein [Methylobacillus sp.]